MTIKLTFDEAQIQALFGHEAAENEAPERLREYYFKTSTYDQVVTDLPLRILVGHKGIGKSALFQVAMAEEDEAGKLTVLIRPDDIVGLGTDTTDFLKTIREWKSGLTEIIARNVLNSFGASDESLLAKFSSYGGKVADFLKETLPDISKLNLTPAKQQLISHFLKDQAIYVYIDDLDRGWQGRPEDNARISALLNAVRDISTENRGIYFRISLRSDVYFLVRTSDESTDKVEGSVIWHSWTNHEIYVLWIKRIESFYGREIDEPRLLATKQNEISHYIHSIMQPRYSGMGHWENAPMYRVIMSLIRRRPRDLVKLCTLAARRTRARKKQRIDTKDLKDSFEEYSQGRLQDTINEFRSELRDIERLLMGMKPSRKERTTKQGYTYRTDGLVKKLRNIQEQGQFRFANGEMADPQALAGFMYKINFLTARKDRQGLILRKYFEESRYLYNQFADFGFDWEVHPAYRWALQPDDIQGVFARLELSADD